MVDILKAREKAKKGKKKDRSEEKPEETPKEEKKGEETVESGDEKTGRRSGKKKKKKGRKTSGKDRGEPAAETEKEEEEPEPEEEESEIPEEELIELLAFKLGDETYSIPIDSIEEIITYQAHTDVPNTEDHVSGVLSLRGRMIPVIEGRARLGHNKKDVDENTRIIIVKDGDEFIGIIVDSVLRVINVREGTIEETPPVITGVEADYIQGVCYIDKELVILLDFDRFLRL